jgi:hypothetical protein
MRAPLGRSCIRAPCMLERRSCRHDRPWYGRSRSKAHHPRNSCAQRACGQWFHAGHGGGTIQTPHVDAPRVAPLVLRHRRARGPRQAFFTSTSRVALSCPACAATFEKPSLWLPPQAARTRDQRWSSAGPLAAGRQLQGPLTALLSACHCHYCGGRHGGSAIDMRCTVTGQFQVVPPHETGRTRRIPRRIRSTASDPTTSESAPAASKSCESSPVLDTSWPRSPHPETRTRAPRTVRRWTRKNQQLGNTTAHSSGATRALQRHLRVVYSEGAPHSRTSHG